ncbi:hypothetical protein GCM10023328_10730 [Modestobacter marinus]|uniref:Secreted protein n=1 Tax=Modestobacter marinus TaxID=477641 RepID=A0A846LRA3_9ACTN|nr:hypothetical protein [Modestobacter marinus]NIH70001.1 hypothetical protein [Modestobacter marinus]GGL82097.1 hypothetical protein GCM10011589_43120 [Modestobacter marinus]
MRTRTRTWVCGSSVAALLLVGTGTAAASPPAPGPGAGTSDGAIGYATALLYGEDRTGGGGAESLFEAYAPAGVPAFARGEVFIGGYECLTEDSVPAQVTGLESARATGWLRYECGSAEGTVRGYAAVHLRWTGHGEVVEQSWTDEEGCTVTLQVRPARVTGGMLAVVPGVGSAVLTLNAEDDADIRQERRTC